VDAERVAVEAIQTTLENEREPGGVPVGGPKKVVRLAQQGLLSFRYTVRT
jgi:hypothetical protein